MPTIETFDVTVGSDEWHKLRSTDVTASAAGCLLGVHDYLTAYEMWALKSGRMAADPEETAPMKRGRLLEPVAVALLREERPDWQVTASHAYYRDTEARIGATPDAFAEAPDHDGRGIVQVKTVEHSIFRTKWRNPSSHEVEVPLWIAAQAIIEAKLSGCSWAVVVPLVVGFGLGLYVIEIPVHDALYERIKSEVAAFWRMIEDGKSPPPDYGRDSDVLSAIYAEDDGTTIDLTSDNEMPALLEERAAINKQTTANRKRGDEIRATLLHKIGDASTALVAGGMVTAKTVHRSGYEVGPSSYRDFRFKAR